MFYDEEDVEEEAERLASTYKIYDLRKIVSNSHSSSAKARDQAFVMKFVAEYSNEHSTLRQYMKEYEFKIEDMVPKKTMVKTSYATAESKDHSKFILSEIEEKLSGN